MNKKSEYEPIKKQVILKMKKNSRSPLIKNPLRMPGQSSEEEINKVIVEEVIPHIAYPILFTIGAMWSWLYWLEVIEPSNPIVITIIAIASFIYSYFKLRKTKNYLVALRLGRDGERAVGQTLEGFRKRGYRIFHDLVGEGFNLDHIIISEKGVYSIETKTRSKPKRGECIIRYDENGLSINNSYPSMDAIIQAKSQKKWLEKIIKELTGVEVIVNPVVVFPGWYVKNKIGNSVHNVWILEPKALPTYINGKPDVLSLEQVNVIANHISNFIRKTYDKNPNTYEP